VSPPHVLARLWIITESFLLRFFSSRVIRVTPEGTEPVVVREGKAVAMGFEHKTPGDDSVKESSPAPELMPVDA
jgi:hypothetical protein